MDSRKNIEDPYTKIFEDESDLKEQMLTKIISYFTVFQKEYHFFDQLFEYFYPSNSEEIIDINNDGIMEIVIILPTYEGLSFKVLTYKDGNFNGDRIIKTTLKP